MDTAASKTASIVRSGSVSRTRTASGPSSRRARASIAAEVSTPVDPIAEGDQLGGHEAGAATDVEDGAHPGGVRRPQLVQEGRPAPVTGVHDDLVVDPCEPCVRVSLAHEADPRTAAEPRSDAEDLGLGGRELLVGQHALLVQLRELLQLGGLLVLLEGRPERREQARRTAALAARRTWPPDGEPPARTPRSRCPRRRPCGRPCVEVPCQYLSVGQEVGSLAAGQGRFGHVGGDTDLVDQHAVGRAARQRRTPAPRCSRRRSEAPRCWARGRRRPPRRRPGRGRPPRAPSPPGTPAPSPGSRSSRSIVVVTPSASFVTNSRSRTRIVPLSTNSIRAGAIRPVNLLPGKPMITTSTGPIAIASPC